MAISSITHYFDYKSPYAYLAQEETVQLGVEFGIEVDFQPYTLHIPSYLGAAELDQQGRDTLNVRNDHQWRRVRYSYMDCRREANRRGLTIRGPRKIFDSSIAHIGMLYAKSRGDFRPFHDMVFERFWKRELEDMEQAEVVQALLEEVGVEAADFPAYVQGEGRELHDSLRAEAEAQGIFGVPSYRVAGELFWGAERIARVREVLAGP